MILRNWNKYLSTKFTKTKAEINYSYKKKLINSNKLLKLNLKFKWKLTKIKLIKNIKSWNVN